MTGEPPIESVLDSVVAATPGGAYRRRRDGDQPLLDADDGLAALTGWDADELAGEGGGWLELVAIDDRDRLRDAVAAADPGEGVELTYRVRRPDGELRRVQDRMRVSGDDPTVIEGVLLDETERFGDRWLSDAASDDGTDGQTDADDRAVAEPESDAGSETAASRASASDQATPRSVTRARRDAALLDAILEAIPVHLYVKDDDAVHLRVSNYLDRSEPYVGKTDPEIDEVTEEHARQAYEDDLRVIEDGDPVLDKEEFLPALDQWNLTSKVPWTEDGEVRGLVGVSRKITERKRAQQELRRKTERLAEFADVVSTDIRTPLNVARERVELAKAADEKRAADPDARSQVDPDEHVDEIADAVDRANGIIDDVLALSRQDGSELETEPLRLNSVALAAWQDVDAPAATLELPDGEPVLRANRAQCRRLLANLFQNAVTHAEDTESGGETAARHNPAVSIVVGVTEDGFAVEDDGPGIPPEDRDRVFDPSYATGEDGTGFGLTIVEEIADAHGWTVSIGESDETGARFEIEGVDWDGASGNGS
ncbi:PAS domain-containing sensor histidine kinase [Natronoarchaeum mannanilyticum]|uniref:histidine kinase n=1 Tax=Natronoarchaeum mannanilyticum TaxID=926360 RepID=A0AAV3TAH5_9EURY